MTQKRKIVHDKVKADLLIFLLLGAFVSSVVLTTPGIRANIVRDEDINETYESKIKSCDITLEVFGDPGEFTLELVLIESNKSKEIVQLGSIHPKGPSLEDSLTLEENYEKYGKECIKEWNFDLTMLGTKHLPQKPIHFWSLHIKGNKTELTNINDLGLCVLSSFTIQWVDVSYRTMEHPVFNQMADLEVYIYGQSCELIELESNGRVSGTMFGSAGFIGIDTFYDEHFVDFQGESSSESKYVKDVISDAGGYEIYYAIEELTGYVTRYAGWYILWRTAKTAQDFNLKAFWYIATHGCENALDPGAGLLACYDTILLLPGTYLTEGNCDGYIGGTTREGSQVFWWQHTCKGEIFNFWDRYFTHRYKALFWVYLDGVYVINPPNENYPEYENFKLYGEEWFYSAEAVYDFGHCVNLTQHETASSDFKYVELTTFAFMPTEYWSETGILVHFYVFVKVNYQPREGEYIKFYINGAYQTYQLTDSNGRVHFNDTFSQIGDYSLKARRNDGCMENTLGIAHITTS